MIQSRSRYSSDIHTKSSSFFAFQISLIILKNCIEIIYDCQFYKSYNIPLLNLSFKTAKIATVWGVNTKNSFRILLNQYQHTHAWVVATSSNENGTRGFRLLFLCICSSEPTK